MDPSKPLKFDEAPEPKIEEEEFKLNSQEKAKEEPQQKKQKKKSNRPKASHVSYLESRVHSMMDDDPDKPLFGGGESSEEESEEESDSDDLQPYDLTDDTSDVKQAKKPE